VLQKTLEAFKLWHVFHNAFPRLSKFTLGNKIDGLFTDVIESIFLAGYANHEQKLQFIIKASTRLDLLKFFLQVAWEIKCLDYKQYAAISPLLHEVGKMIGGWRKSLNDKPPLK